MSYQLRRITPTLAPDELQQRIQKLIDSDAPRYRRLWAYYRNPMLPATSDANSQGSEKPYRQAQEWGLPPRITGVMRSNLELLEAQPVEGVARKEVVIENDIAWRIETMIDFLFGKPIVVTATASEPAKREAIQILVAAILSHNGGIMFLQQLALMGAVYGFVDVLVKLKTPVEAEPSADGAGPSASPPDAEPAPDASVTPAAPTMSCPSSPSISTPAGASNHVSPDVALEHIARFVRLEIVEPARALPLLSTTDWRQVEAYIQAYSLPAPRREVSVENGLLRKVFDCLTTKPARQRDQVLATEILTAHEWQRYENEKLVAEGSNSLGILPLVHIQNAAVPFEYSGTSEVEHLIPLQDELNTRLSDRAHRITMQSFKMYLGKGIDNFTSLPVAPGRMWMSDNEDAEVIEFGGDASAPSEDRHILELREAMDKTSSVTPIAAGAIKGRIGHLTSAAALRVTLAALLAKTARKRITYGEGIAKMLELSLAWLDRAGLFRTHLDERKLQIHWPNPLPDNETERLEEARLKLQLGVPSDTILRELGYSTPTAG